MRWVMVGAMALVVSALVGAAGADDYPNRPIHVVIGFAAGSGADILTRFYASKLAEISGQSTVVENRPGAVGVIAATVVTERRPRSPAKLRPGWAQSPKPTKRRSFSTPRRRYR